MDQKTLYEFEKKCIQEEAPACQSACPLHVDVRTFVSHVGNGKFADAWKTLNKTLPFPGILGRICDHPCEEKCLRRDLGGAVSIGALEKFCVNQPKPRIRVIPVPKKNISMAVVGEDLSSLVACLDLLRKGYDVTLFNSRFSTIPELGGSLRKFIPEVFSEKILEQELEILGTLGLRVEKKGMDKLIPILQKKFSAVYLGLDSMDGVLLGKGQIPLNRSFAMDEEGVFAGGSDIENSIVIRSFQGRAAALSMERFVQKVGLLEGRQNEGPYSTRLYTSTEKIEPQPRVYPEGGAYLPKEACEEARRCINCQCLECIKVCPYLEQFKGYPKRYAREIYNSASIVMGNHAANLMVNSCSLCGLCKEVCPENFSMADLCLSARKDLVEKNKMPPSAHEFALMDMEFSNSDSFKMARHAPDNNESRYVFFPGCQLSGSSPGHVMKSYEYLCLNFAEDTGLIMQCCGAPAHWSGNISKTRQAVSKLQETLDLMGRPEVIIACSSCFEMFGKYLPEIQTTTLWQVIDELALPAEASVTGNRVMALHDPCTSRHAPLFQNAARSIARKLGIKISELEFSREKTECCGFGGLMENANPELAKKQLERRVSQSDFDYLAYCAMCRESLKGAGKRTAHLLDFIFPESGEYDPAGRERTGLSESRENRAGLKNDFLKLWGEAGEKEPSIRLHITPEVQVRLDERRILHSDIRQVIDHAEKNGSKLESLVSGHLMACHRPSMVTFWVEYSPFKGGYRIHNSYCHRMQIMGVVE